MYPHNAMWIHNSDSLSYQRPTPHAYPGKAELARQTAFDLAAKYGLGLFEPSSEQAEMWRPEAGKLVLTGEKKIWEAPEAPGFWQRILGKSRADRLPRPRLPDWM